MRSRGSRFRKAQRKAAGIRYHSSLRVFKDIQAGRPLSGNRRCKTGCRYLFGSLGEAAVQLNALGYGGSFVTRTGARLHFGTEVGSLKPYLKWSYPEGNLMDHMAAHSLEFGDGSGPPEAFTTNP